MSGLTEDTFRRPADMSNRSDPAVLYVRSYLLTRTVVGIIGILLPLIFIVGEAYFLKGGVHVRGSISAYYHTSMRDIFVGGLCVIGFLLITYMSGLTRTWDFWLSLVAGVALILVVFFPTNRPGLSPDAPLCGTTPEPQGCSPVQQQFGEDLVAGIHFTSAIVFILCLAWISFLFARREKKYRSQPMARVQRVCGWAIVGAVAWVILGELMEIEIGKLTPLYLGEVISIWAFGVSWLLKGLDLRSLLRPDGGTGATRA